jgi:hypothetical protein
LPSCIVDICSVGLSTDVSVVRKSKIKSALQKSENQIKFGECLLTFSSESFVFPSLSQQLQGILLFVLYGCESLSLPLSKKHGLRVLRRGWCGEYLDLSGRKLQDAGEDYIIKSFITCTRAYPKVSGLIL